MTNIDVAPLYWLLPPSVLYQWLRQIMLLRGHSLISLLFILVKEYGSRINLEILILHFENKNCFDVSLKQFAFEILQLLGYFLSWKRDYLLVFGNEVFSENTLWGDLSIMSVGFLIKKKDKKNIKWFRKNSQVKRKSIWQQNSINQ